MMKVISADEGSPPEFTGSVEVSTGGMLPVSTGGFTTASVSLGMTLSVALGSVAFVSGLSVALDSDTEELSAGGVFTEDRFAAENAMTVIIIVVTIRTARTM